MAHWLLPLPHKPNPSAKAKEPFFANAPLRMLKIFWLLFILQNEIQNILKLYLRLESFEQMNRIKEVLDEKGIKQTWLAEQLGKSYNMVNAYVQNRQQPRIEVLYDIAKILDVNVKDLLIDNDNKKNKKWARNKK